jgi:hypothetical protein
MLDTGFWMLDVRKRVLLSSIQHPASSIGGGN